MVFSTWTVYRKTIFLIKLHHRVEKTFFYFRGHTSNIMPSYKSYVRTGYAKRRKSRKSTTKSKRTRFTRPKRRTVRRFRKRGVVSRIPRLIGDLQYNAKRPLRFTTTVKQLYTWRVTPEVINTTLPNGSYPSTMYISASNIEHQSFTVHFAYGTISS